MTANCNKSSMDYVGIGCCTLAVILYLNTLSAGFVYDDRRAILGNADVLSTTSWLDLLANDFWGTQLGDTGSHGSYRPVCTLSYKFNHWLGGLKPFGYHLTNVVLHAVASALVLKLSRQLLGGTRVWSGSSVAALLFAAHPIHTEAVASLVGRADLFACIFYLLAIICYKRHIELRGSSYGRRRPWLRLAAAIGCAVLATLSKETAISALVVCGLFDAALGFCGQRDKHRKRSLAIIGIATLALLQFRLSLPRPSVPFSTADNPTAKDASAWTRFLTFAYLPAFNTLLLLLPSTLSFDWGMDAIPRISSWTDSRNLVSTVFYGGLLSLALIIANQHLVLRKLATSHPHQRINSAIKRRIQVQSSTSACVKSGTSHHGSTAVTTSPTSATTDDKRGVFCAAPNNVLHRMSIVRNYLISGRGTNSISAYTNKRARRKRSTSSLFHGPTTTSANEEASSHQQTLLGGPALHRQTFRTNCSGRNGKAPKIRSLTAYTGELGGGGGVSGGAGDTSGSSTPTSTSSAYSSSSCFSAAPVTSLSHVVLEPQSKCGGEGERRKLPPTCVSALVAVALLILPFVPATNLLFYVGFVVAERILYLPSVGFCLCIGIGFDQIRSGGGGSGSGKSFNGLSHVAASLLWCFTRRNKSLNGIAGGARTTYDGRSSNSSSSRVFKVGKGGGGVGGGVGGVVSANGASSVSATSVSGKCFIRQSCCRVSQIRRRTALMCTVILVLSTFSYRTVQRNFDWHDEESLYKSAIHVNPPKALGNLGSVLSAQGKFEEAKTVLLQALTYRPNMADVHYNLGVLFQNQRDFPKAVESFQRAIQYRPSLAVAYLNMGASLIGMGQNQEAAKVLRKGSRLDGNGLRDRPAHDNARMASLLQLGGLYTQQGKLQRALAVYREALHSHPERYPLQGIYYRIGDILARLHQWTEAEKFHKAALEVQSDHVATQLSYGNMLARNLSRVSEAEQWFKRALQISPLDSSVHHHYAEFLTSVSRDKEACEHRLRAVELSPDDYSLVTNAATALRLMERKVEAEVYYKQAVRLRPNDPRAHTNYGAILHLLGRTQQAINSYRQALKLQPGDGTTLTNLAKLGVFEAE